MNPHRFDLRLIGRSALLLALVAGVSAPLAGCKQKKKVEEEAPPPPAPAPTGPVYEEYTFQELDLDPRVQFASTAMPQDRKLAVAIGELATAILNGDHYAAQSMLDGATAGDLAKMESVGLWEKATDKIQVVRLCTLFDQESAAQFGLAVQNKDGAVLLGFVGMKSGEDWLFSALPIKDRAAPVASALDGAPLAPRGVQMAAAFPVSTETTPTGRVDEDTGSGSDSGSPSNPGTGPKVPNF